MPSIECRLLIDGPLSGPWNMAVDEVLLASASQGLPTLRFYGWTEPTLSLGYFQKHDARRAHAASQELNVVRRASGGGAIVHDQEITYCLALPEPNPRVPRMGNRRFYDGAHRALIDALLDWGIEAYEATAYDAAPRPSVAPASEPFLCFQRRAVGDVLLGEHKICGSAQRKRAEAFAQHGSLLLARSKAAPELPGIAELSHVRLQAQEVVAAWSTRMAVVLGLALQSATLSEQELATVRNLAVEKYFGQDWTFKR